MTAVFSKTRKFAVWGASLVLIGTFIFPCLAQEKTEINDAAAAKMLLGRHLLSLQWISWDHYGSATVTNDRGVFRIKGEQKGRGNDDLLRVEGLITEISSRQFRFSGSITTRVSHINGGEPCIREGEFTFKVTGKRRYWRMQEIDNPCDEAADYVDIYFK